MTVEVVVFTCAFPLRRRPVSGQTLAAGGLSFAVRVRAAATAPATHCRQHTTRQQQLLITRR